LLKSLWFIACDPRGVKKRAAAAPPPVVPRKLQKIKDLLAAICLTLSKTGTYTGGHGSSFPEACDVPRRRARSARLGGDRRRDPPLSEAGCAGESTLDVRQRPRRFRRAGAGSRSLGFHHPRGQRGARSPPRRTRNRADVADPAGRQQHGGP